MLNEIDIKMLNKRRSQVQFGWGVNARCLWGFQGKYPVRESVGWNNFEYNWEDVNLTTIFNSENWKQSKFKTRLVK